MTHPHAACVEEHRLHFARRAAQELSLGEARPCDVTLSAMRVSLVSSLATRKPSVLILKTGADAEERARDSLAR